MTFDPDQPDPRLGDILARYLQSSLGKLREQILKPTGGTAASQQWNAQKAITRYNQIAGELRGLKRRVADWTGKAIDSGRARGVTSAARQIKELKAFGWEPPGDQQFGNADLGAVKVLASDTYQDLSKAIDSTGDRIRQTLHAMADNGLTVDEVNQALIRGFVEGNPTLAINELRDKLLALHGDELTIINRSGNPMDFETAKYARMVANTRMREASVIARTNRLIEVGVSHVIITGRISKNPCTAYLGKIYTLGPSDGKYPSLDSIDGPPFHPNCSKTTAPFVPALASKVELRAGQQDAASEKIQQLGVTDYQAVRYYKDNQVRQEVQASQQKVVDAIRNEARKAGYEPPPWSPSTRGEAQ